MRKLYGYYRSSASYRVRIALNLKELKYEQIHVNLIKNGGEQFAADYKKLNPQALVPAFIDEDANANLDYITQSVAIIEYLEEVYPTPSLLPKNFAERAWVRSFSQAIACDIQPINNLRILKYLTGELKVTEEQKNEWYLHWLKVGFVALETLLENHAQTGSFCHGNTPTLADVCLVPQIYNAIRYKLDLSPYKRLMKIYEHCEKHPAFILAYPVEPTES